MDVEFEFDYKPQLASTERNPYLCFYLSRDAGHTLVRVDPSIDRRVKLRIADSSKTGQSTTLSVCAMCETRTSSGEPASNEAGSNLVYLKNAMDPTRQSTVSLPLFVWNARRNGSAPCKGTIVLRFPIAKFNRGISPFERCTPFTAIPANRGIINEVVAGIVQRERLVYEKPPSFESTKYLVHPLWEFNSWQLPGFTFGAVRAQPSPESWWVNAANIALRRHFPKMKLAEARAYLVESATEREVMAVVSKMHSVFINYCTYLSDGTVVDKRSHTVNMSFSSASKSDIQEIPMEAFVCNVRSRGTRISSKGKRSFDPAYVPSSSDCEDGGAEQGFESIELATRTDFGDPVLLRMQRERQKYFYLQVLMGVDGAQLSDGATDSEAYGKLGGHMAGAYISREAFFEYHQRYNMVSEPYVGLKMGNLGSRAPIMFLEGTGLLDPEASPEYRGNMKAYAYLLNNSRNTFTGIKFIEAQDNTKLNRFYRTVQSVTVLDLLDAGYTSARHVMLTAHPDTGRNSTGCKHIDFVNRVTNISTYAQPPLSEKEVAVTQELMNQTFPIEAFETPESLSNAKACNEILERVKVEAKRQNRPKCDNYTVAQFYVRYDQLQHLDEKWCELVKFKDRIFDFKYYNEEITAGVGGYAAFFYVSE